MPHETPDKFERIALLKSGPWTPVPKFFYRLRLFFPDLPGSWWTTLDYIFNVTLGSPGGVTGTLSYSEVPVQSFQFKNYVAALEGYGRLLTVEKATYDDRAGSTFNLNPDATEGDWLGFHDVLRAAFQEGYLDRSITAADVKKFFANFQDQPLQHPPLWSTTLLRCMTPQEDEGELFEKYKGSDWYKMYGELDVWDDKNWIKRGFDTMLLHKWFDRAATPGLGCEAYWFVTKLFHEAWVRSREEDDRPLLPDDLELLNGAVSMNNEEENAARDLRPILEQYFKKVEIDGEAWLESEWLTKQWQAARNNYQINQKIKNDPKIKSFARVLEAVETERRTKILSRRRDGQ